MQKHQDYVDQQGRRIVKYGRITAVYASIHAKDCKVFVEPTLNPDGTIKPVLLTVAEFVVLVGMAIIAQADTHHEPHNSELWIGDSIGDVLKCQTVREVVQLAEITNGIWTNHKLRIELSRARRR